MELQPILHVWINHDNDLVDLTVTHTTHAIHGKTTVQASEVIVAVGEIRGRLS